MSRQDIEDKLHQLRQEYRKQTGKEQKKMTDNLHEASKIRAKLTYMQQQLADLEEERRQIHARLNRLHDENEKTRQSLLKDLEAIGMTGL